MRPLAPILLAAALLLASCSGGQEAIDLPDEPPGAVHLDDSALQAQLDTLADAMGEITDTEVEWSAVFDVTDTGPEDLIDYYDEQLRADGWALAEGPGDISDSLGASWWRDGQSVVLVTVADLEGRDLALLSAPGEAS